MLLGGIPLFDGGNDDPARRFVHLIDELYDRHVNLVCTAAARADRRCTPAASSRTRSNAPPRA